MLTAIILLTMICCLWRRNRRLKKSLHVEINGFPASEAGTLESHGIYNPTNSTMSHADFLASQYLDVAPISSDLNPSAAFPLGSNGSGYEPSNSGGRSANAAGDAQARYSQLLYSD